MTPRPTSRRSASYRPALALAVTLCAVFLGVGYAQDAPPGFEGTHFRLTPPKGWVSKSVQDGAGVVLQPASGEVRVVVQSVVLSPEALKEKRWESNSGMPALSFVLPMATKIVEKATGKKDVKGFTTFSESVVAGRRAATARVTFPVGKGRYLSVEGFASERRHGKMLACAVISNGQAGQINTNESFHALVAAAYKLLREAEIKK